MHICSGCSRHILSPIDKASGKEETAISDRSHRRRTYSILRIYVKYHHCQFWFLHEHVKTQIKISLAAFEDKRCVFQCDNARPASLQFNDQTNNQSAWIDSLPLRISFVLVHGGGTQRTTVLQWWGEKGNLHMADKSEVYTWLRSKWKPNHRERRKLSWGLDLGFDNVIFSMF